MTLSTIYDFSYNINTSLYTNQYASVNKGLYELFTNLVENLPSGWVLIDSTIPEPSPTDTSLLYYLCVINTGDFCFCLGNKIDNNTPASNTTTSLLWALCSGTGATYSLVKNISTIFTKNSDNLMTSCSLTIKNVFNVDDDVFILYSASSTMPIGFIGTCAYANEPTKKALLIGGNMLNSYSYACAFDYESKEVLLAYDHKAAALEPIINEIEVFRYQAIINLRTVDGRRVFEHFDLYYRSGNIYVGRLKNIVNSTAIANGVNNFLLGQDEYTVLVPLLGSSTVRYAAMAIKI